MRRRHHRDQGPGAGLVLTLANRFMRRSTALRRSTWPVVVVVALLVAAFEVIAGQSLSPKQVVDRDLGSYGAFAGFGAITVVPGSAVRETLNHDLTASAGVDVNVAVIAPDFSVPSLGHASISLKEARWPGLFGNGLEMISGRQPSGPGDVLVANPPPSVTVGSVLDAYGERVRLRVVGTAYDRYARSTSLLVGPGTWAGLPREIAADNAVLRGYPVLYWDGSHVDRVLRALTSSLASLPPADATVEETELAVAVRASYGDVHSVMRRTGTSWVERSPAAYAVPSLVLPPLVTLLVFAVNRRWAGRARTRLQACGIDVRIASVSLWLAIAAWLIIAATIGAVIGWVGGTAVAFAVAQVQHTPVPAWTPPFAAWLRILGLVVLMAGVCLWTLRDQGPPRASAEDGKARGRGDQARRWLAVTAAVLSVGQLGKMTSAPRAMVFTGCLLLSVALLLPEVLGAGLRRAAPRDARARLAVRQMLSNTASPVAVAAVMTITLGLATGFTILLDTMIRTASSQSVPDVLPGQVMIRDRSADSVSPPRSTASLAAGLLAKHALVPVQLNYLIDEPESANPRQVTVNASDAILMSVETASDAEAITGVKLTASDRRALEAGGALLWPVEDIHADVVSIVADGARTSLPAHTVQVAKAGWQAGTAGLVLNSTAHENHWPLSHGALLYTNVPEHVSVELVGLVQARGIDVQTALVYRPPSTPIPPAALWLTAFVLATISLMSAFTAARVHVRSLRAPLAALLAVGVPPGWARGVVLWHALIVVGTGAMLGIGCGALGVLVAASRISGFVLSIPVAQVSWLVGAVLGASIMGFWLAALGLRPREREN